MMRAEPAADTEQGIVAACTDYAASWLEGEPGRMASCLHPGLAKRAVVDHRSGALTLEESPFDEMVASAGRGPRAFSRDLRIDVLDVTAGIASASVLSEPWLDLIHLARFHDRWRIVNVLYEPRPTAVHDSADRAAVAGLLDVYAVCGFDEDLELVRAIHHPALAERRVEDEAGGGLELEDSTLEEVIGFVADGLELERFERAWDAHVLEVGRDIAAARITVGWWDIHLHAARFGSRWMIVNILYRNRPEVA